MTRADADKIVFSEIELLGTAALHSELRIERNTVPKGLHMYEVRHADEDWFMPRQIARRVLVNFYGTLITAKPLALGEYGIALDKPFDFGHDAVTIREFMQKHQIKPKARDSHER
jgi:hypothetical protein